MLIHLWNKRHVDYRETYKLRICFWIRMKVIKGLSLNSTLASGVPGTVSGMFYASTKYGSVILGN